MQTNISPRPAAAVLRLAFDRKGTVHIKEVKDLLAKILGHTGCPTCGLGGLDIVLRRAEILGARPFVATLEGQLR